MNAAWGEPGPLLRTRPPPWRGVYFLHLRGNTLTLSAAEVGHPVAPQPGSWTVPDTFYVLLCAYDAGHEFTLTAH